MPEIVTLPFETVQYKYEKAVEKYDELVEELEIISSEINFGPDLSDEGREVFEDLNNALTILTATGRFLPDTIKQ